MLGGSTPQIQRLCEDVINKIAAGEVVVRPASAIKELIENSIDAGATNISVSVRHGGLKFIQIQDNGNGIQPADFPLLCERFATSKISSANDLLSLSTFGFRGEALASISQVARLQITSMVPGARCAYKARFENGKIVTSNNSSSSDVDILDNVKPCAGVPGTLIVVEDMFYNVPLRREALRHPNEEYRILLEMLSKYAIRYDGISFTCKKTGSGGDVSIDLSTEPTASKLKKISSIYGSKVSRELIPISINLTSPINIQGTGFVSNANFSLKKLIFILFINGRLVDCTPLKKALDSLFNEYLPKGSHPFIFLDFNMEPETLDVNVHPTKQEIRFLHELELIEAASKAVDSVVRTSNTSRTYYAQSILTSNGIQLPEEKQLEKSMGSKEEAPEDRTCCSEDNDEGSEPSDKTCGNFSSNVNNVVESKRNIKTYPKSVIRIDAQNPRGSIIPMLRSDNKEVKDDEPFRSVSFAQRTKRSAGAPPLLSSVRDLVSSCKASSSLEVTNIFKNHTYVGVLDAKCNFVFIQHETKLFLLDFVDIAVEITYQVILNLFGDMESVPLSVPVPVSEMIFEFLDLPDSQWDASLGSREEVTQQVCRILGEKNTLLFEYFSIEIIECPDTGQLLLTSLPLIYGQFMPDLRGLPDFFFRLGAEVEWTEEQDCFHGISRILADLYAEWHGIESSSDENEAEFEASRRQRDIQHTYLAHARNNFHAPNSFLEDNIIREIASVDKLYKIFERC